LAFYRRASIFVGGKMPAQYIPILMVAMVAGLFPLAALAILKRAAALPPQAPEATQAQEIRGSAPEDMASDGSSVKFYIAGALFVIFAAAMGLLFPWSIQFSQMGAYGLLVMLTFLGILLAGYAWLYQKGALDWR
jgi:NADH-quinone oxidoreductase subunit A